MEFVALGSAPSASARRRPSASPLYAARKTGGSGASPTTELSLSEDILPAAVTRSDAPRAVQI